MANVTSNRKHAKISAMARNLSTAGHAPILGRNVDDNVLPGGTLKDNKVLYFSKNMRVIKSYKILIKDFMIFTRLITMRGVKILPKPKYRPDSRALLHFCLAPSVSELVDTTDFKDGFESLSFSRGVRAQGFGVFRFRVLWPKRECGGNIRTNWRDHIGICIGIHSDSRSSTR